MSCFLNNIFTEIQFTYHKILPFKVYNSVVLVCSELCNYHHYLISEPFHPPDKRNAHPSASLPIPSSLQPQATVIVLYASMDLPFWTFHVNGIMKYMAICGQLLSLNKFCRFICVVASVPYSISWLDNISLYGCIVFYSFLS